MDELNDIWKDQKEFNKNFIDIEKMSKKEKVQQTKEYVLHLNSECDELLREMAWKVHRKQNTEIIESNLLEEVIDIFKYWLSIMQLWGFKPEDFVDEYYRKSSVVEQRYKQELQLDFESDRIVGVDIDGVLADYPYHFVNFINEKIGTNYKPEDITTYDLYYGCLGLPVQIVKNLKDEFRQSGQNRYIPLIKGAKDFLKELQEDGYRIVLLSARPYKKYKRIFADTQEWLKKNKLVHDAILWDEDKCERLIREYGKDNVKFFIEDHLGNANSIAKISKVYLINKPYNQGKTHKNVLRVDDLQEVLQNELVRW